MIPQKTLSNLFLKILHLINSVINANYKFQFIELNGRLMWCNFGANLVQHFIGRYSRCSRYRTKSHDNQTKRVCKLACKRASETKLRAFCEKQNRVRSTTSKEVKLARSIIKKDGSICKNSAALFTFKAEYDIIVM